MNCRLFDDDESTHRHASEHEQEEKHQMGDRGEYRDCDDEVTIPGIKTPSRHAEI